MGSGFITTLFSLVVMAVIFSGCITRGKRHPDAVLSEVPDQPAWQIEETETVHLRIARETEHIIPRFNEWNPSFMGLFNPSFIVEEEGIPVVRAVHITKPGGLAALTNSGVVDGLIRWELGSDDIDVYMFPQVLGEPQWIYGVDVPENPGIEYCQLESNWTGGEPGEGRFISAALHVYRNDGTELMDISLPPLQPYISFANLLPLDYPNTSRLMYQETHPAYDFRLIDLTDGGSEYLDPRSGDPSISHPPQHWLAETGAWFFSRTSREEDLSDQGEIRVVRPDSSEVLLRPWLWGGFKYDGLGYSVFMSEGPFYWDDHRHFLVHSMVHSGASDEILDGWWAIRFDPGSDTCEPIWFREEPNEGHYLEQVITIGPDDRPYWVRLFMNGNRIRVIDLVSGECVIDFDIEFGPLYMFGHKPSLLARTAESINIPGVFIFHPAMGSIIQLDLEIDQ